jgi:hypothetical protein
MIALAAVGCKRLLDGVLECRDHFVEIRRQSVATFDDRPQRYRRCLDDVSAERDIVEVVVKVWPPAAMTRVTSLPNSGPAILPATRATEIDALLVREEHVRTAIEALGVALQAAGVPRER